jgi:sn-glycerol 3-phosphate transport system permease protein
VLLQLMIMPDVLIVENYHTLNTMGLTDTILAIAMPYFGSAFGIFLMRQTFKSVPKELDDAARIEGAGTLRTLVSVYVPLAKPVYLAYGLVSVSYHWNNFLWPLIVTNSVTARPLTVGLQIFSSGDQGIAWPILTAATLLSAGPLLVAFLLFQRQFVQSFLRAGIR